MVHICTIRYTAQRTEVFISSISWWYHVWGLVKQLKLVLQKRQLGYQIVKDRLPYMQIHSIRLHLPSTSSARLKHHPDRMLNCQEMVCSLSHGQVLGLVILSPSYAHYIPTGIEHGNGHSPPGNFPQL